MTGFRIVRHPGVDRDLADIMDLIAEYSGTDTALRILDEIETVVRSLETLPHKGSLRNHIAPGLRAIPAGRKGVVCFIADDANKTVKIVAIGYAGSEWEAEVKSRS